MKLLAELVDLDECKDKRLKKKKPLAEGVMDINDIDGSDSAADLWSDAHGASLAALVKVLKRGMRDRGNSYNTPGFINVALIIAEKLSVEDIDNNHELEKLVSDCYEELVKNNDWSHLKGYKKLVKKITQLHHNSGTIPS